MQRPGLARQGLAIADEAVIRPFWAIPVAASACAGEGELDGKGVYLIGRLPRGGRNSAPDRECWGMPVVCITGLDSRYAVACEVAAARLVFVR